jgi:hypothetical protein
MHTFFLKKNSTEVPLFQSQFFCNEKIALKRGDLNSDLKRGMAFGDSGIIRGGTTLLF